MMVFVHRRLGDQIRQFGQMAVVLCQLSRSLEGVSSTHLQRFLGVRHIHVNVISREILAQLSLAGEVIPLVQKVLQLQVVQVHRLLRGCHFVPARTTIS